MKTQHQILDIVKSQNYSASWVERNNIYISKQKLIRERAAERRRLEAEEKRNNPSRLAMCLKEFDETRTKARDIFLKLKESKSTLNAQETYSFIGEKINRSPSAVRHYIADLAGLKVKEKPKNRNMTMKQEAEVVEYANSIAHEFETAHSLSKYIANNFTCKCGRKFKFSPIYKRKHLFNFKVKK